MGRKGKRRRNEERKRGNKKEESDRKRSLLLENLLKKFILRKISSYFAYAPNSNLAKATIFKSLSTDCK